MAKLKVKVNSQDVSELALTRTDRWQEFVVTIPAKLVDETMTISLEASEGETVLYHIWLSQNP